MLNKLACGAALSWIGLTIYFISSSKLKIDFTDLLLMMPQYCKMTDLIGNGYVTFSPETMIKFCFGFILLHFVTWWMTAEEVVEKTDRKVSKLVNFVETQILNDKGKTDALLDTSKALVDNIDLEFEHCAALIATNNETPGRRVGGEVEWATGETSSEDGDATREVIGAHIKKLNKETEDEKIFRCLTNPDGNMNMLEPNLNHFLSERRKNIMTSWLTSEVQT